MWRDRLQKHNAHGSSYTSDYAPWELVAYIGFQDREKAFAFEKYIKVGSGHAFAKKRLW